MNVRRLRPEDVPLGMRLSTQVGWNQIEADWRRLLDLDPETCFAGWVGDELVATATLLTFEDRVGWIGMVLVDESHRRQGYGTVLFERALDAGVDRGLSTVGLDATDAGRPLYRRAGFVDVAPIERWGGRLEAPPTAEGVGSVVSGPPLEELLALDRRACGVDRRRLLARLEAEDGTRAFLATTSDESDDAGYAVVRPGRRALQVGPVVAPDGETLARLLGAAARSFGDPRVIVDWFPGGEADVFENAGLSRRRRLSRMTHRRETAALVGEDVVAAAGFELG